MALEEELAKVGDAAHLPQEAHRLGAAGAGAHGRISRAARARRSRRRGRQPEAADAGALFERGDEAVERGEIEIGVAPVEPPHGGEAVRLDGGGHALGQARGQDGAEGAVAQVAAGAAGDLGELGGLSSRSARPSNLRSEAKATCPTSRLSPMPMASVATR